MADNEIMIIDERSLKDKIYTVRGVQVMFDFDLAEIYGYTVSAFNQQVKRNIERFPEDFLFELSASEMMELSKSQNVISIQTEGIKGGRSKPVKAFTESGIYVAALSLGRGWKANDPQTAAVAIASRIQSKDLTTLTATTSKA